MHLMIAYLPGKPHWTFAWELRELQLIARLLVWAWIYLKTKFDNQTNYQNLKIRSS